MLSTRSYSGYDAYRPSNAYFQCDRCSQRWRRARMCVEWTNLRVCPPCLDPRPPQMRPPDVFPEGIPFFDARPPNDRPDRLEDDTSLRSVMGGMASPYGLLHPGGQSQQPGALSGLPLYETVATDLGVSLSTESGLTFVTDTGAVIDVTSLGVPIGPDVLADDVTFITGPVAAPSNDADNGPWVPS